MTGPRIDPLADLYNQDPLADLYGEEEEPSAFKRFFSGMKNIASGPYPAGSLAADAGLVNNRKRVVFDRPPLPDNASFLDKVKGMRAEDFGEMAGQMAIEAPLYAVTGLGVAAAGVKLAAKTTNPILKAAFLATPQMAKGASRAKTIGATVLAGIPQEIATGLIGTALTHPSELDSPHKIAVNMALGAGSSIIRGYGANKAFSARIAETRTIPELRVIEQEIVELAVPDELPNQLPNQLRAANVRADAMEAASRQQQQEIAAEMKEILQAKLQRQYEKLASGKHSPTLDKYVELEDADVLLHIAAAKGIRDHLEAAITPSGTGGKGGRPREISYIKGNPGNQELLTSNELQGFYDQLTSLQPYKQRRLSKIQRKLDYAAQRGFGLLEPREVYDMQQGLLQFAHELSKGFDQPKNIIDVLELQSTKKARALVEDLGLISSSTKVPPNFTLKGQSANPLGLITSGKKSIPNHYGNPPTLGQLNNVGSGPQSAQAYVPPSIPTAPVSLLLRTKTASPPNLALNNAEIEMNRFIDYGNKEAQLEREGRQFLLKGGGGEGLGNYSVDKFKRDAQNFLLPTQKVSYTAFDMAKKMLRISVRQRAAITGKLSILNPDGRTYRDGPSSIVEVYQMAGPGKRDHLDRYAHARQVVAGEGENTPFSKEAAEVVVKGYALDHPEVVRAYEEGWIPFTKGMLEMKKGYKNSMMSRASYLAAAGEREAYANTSRAVYSDRGVFGVNSNKARQKPTPDVLDAEGNIVEKGIDPSTKRLADLASSSAQDIENTVSQGEMSRLINEFAKAKMQYNISDDIIKILPHEKPPGLEELVASLDPSLSEVKRRALAEGFLVHPPSSRKYNILLDDGTPVTVELGAELPETLEMLDGWSGGTSNKLNIPGADSQRKVEKGISSVFSVVRDSVGLGIPSDWFEFMLNQRHGYKPLDDPIQFFKDFGKDIIAPVKGFIAQRTQSDAVKRLQVHGAGASFHGDLPKSMSENVDQLLARSGPNGKLIRSTTWKETFDNFASDLANSVRTGAALRELERGADYSIAASTFNNSLGDPYLVGARLAAVSRHVAFLNFPLQANARALQNFVDPQKAAETIFKGLALLTAPTTALWFLQKDNEEVRKLRNGPDGRRFTYFTLPYSDEIYKVPKFYLYGAMFQTPTEAALDFMYSKATNGDLTAADMMEKIGKSALEQLTPNFVPITANAVLPFYTGQTVDPFKGSQQILPNNTKNLLPEDQGNAGTSMAAKMIAEKSGFSAAAIENVFKSFLIGPSYTAYSLADDYIDQTFGKGSKPATFNKFTPFPGIQRVDVSRAGIEYVHKFYKVVSKTQPILASLARAENTGQPGRVDEILAKHEYVIEEAKQIEKFKRDMDRISERIGIVKLNEAWSPEEKKKEIDDLVKIRIEIAKLAMSEYKITHQAAKERRR